MIISIDYELKIITLRFLSNGTIVTIKHSKRYSCINDCLTVVGGLIMKAEQTDLMGYRYRLKARPNKLDETGVILLAPGHPVVIMSLKENIDYLKLNPKACSAQILLLFIFRRTKF